MLLQNLANLTETPIAFSSTRAGSGDIFLADPVNLTLVNLTQHPAWDSGPAWSPDGTQIAIESTRSGAYDIYVMDADGSNPRRVTDDPGEDRMPVWSPDGKSLCFRRQFNDSAKSLHLMVTNAEGTDVRRVADEPVNETDPSWSISNRIVFGQGERRLADLHGLNILASWSPDVRHIAFMNRRATSGSDVAASLCVINNDGSNLQVIGPVEGHINGGRPAWKPKQLQLKSPAVKSPSP